jgi:prokaryotic ubiquitin-like protein Pup
MRSMGMEVQAMSEYARKTQSTRSVESTREASEKSSLGAKGKKIGAELDALLDEIDGVLEENAEEFVSNYVQHGGE